MKKFLLGLGVLLALNQNLIAQSHISPSIAEPTTCIASQFTAEGDVWWKTITLTLTNNCTKAIDFQNATVTFKNTASVSTQFWGYFAPLPYPDNALSITSQTDTDGKYLSTLNLHFPTHQGSSTNLPVGNSIKIVYGMNADTHINGTTNVYVSTPVQTGSLLLKNTTTKPADITQTYALVHLVMNGQNVKNIQLPWASNITVTGLSTGTYSVTADNITGTSGAYQGTPQPSSVIIASGQQANAAISYALVQATGKIGITLQNLPQELNGYTTNPTVTLTNQTGSSITKALPWNNTVVVDNLKEGGMYTFATPLISFNGYRCTPSFTPATLTASSAAPTTNLTYKCTQVAQNTITLNVKGAPASAASIVVQLLPNDGSKTLSQTINLTNGTGTATVMLTGGVIYTLSTPDVTGYTTSFSPQPLTSTANAIETITFTAIAGGTPVALNGQLTVCGTKLCNASGTPIQLKGMSSHGLQWYANCLTTSALDYLATGFKANVIRLSLYVQEGGYETDPVGFTKTVSDLINAASKKGIYVIVDWHILNPGDPNYNLARAKKFFTDIATLHQDKNNIIYEIANEPNGVTWASIKSYAEQVIPVIRAIDNNAPIIVGTRGWSSLGYSEGASYQEIVNNPINATNILYAFHFYAASHGDDVLQHFDDASNELPVFVTEFGTQTYSGDGANDFVMSDKYMQLMASKKIGWVNWNFSDDSLSGAIWKTNTCTSGNWIDSNLKPAGTYIKGKTLNP